MYSLIRVWIGVKLARMLIQVRVVVRTTSGSDSPSTPSLYWMPKIGIQLELLDELEDAAAIGVEKPATRRSETTHGEERGRERDGPRVQRAGSERRSTSAPTSGRKVTTERIGRPSIAYRPSDHEVRADHHDQAERDAQRVVLDATGLDPGEPAAAPPRHRRRCR